LDRCEFNRAKEEEMERQEPQLTPEIAGVLRRYLEIQEEERRLKQEKGMLQSRLKEHLMPTETKQWEPTLNNQDLIVRVRTTETVRCDADELSQRLGPRYRYLLRPDPARIRKYFFKILPHLKPVMELVGSPHPASIRSALKKELINESDLEGLVEITTRRSVSVGRNKRPGREETAERFAA